MERLYRSCFLKSEGNQATPYCSPTLCPMALIFWASFKGLMLRVVQK